MLWKLCRVIAINITRGYIFLKKGITLVRIGKKIHLNVIK